MLTGTMVLRHRRASTTLLKHQKLKMRRPLVQHLFRWSVSVMVLWKQGTRKKGATWHTHAQDDCASSLSSYNVFFACAVELSEYNAWVILSLGLA